MPSEGLPALTDESSDSLRGHLRIFVLPNANTDPPCLFKQRVRLSVTFDIAPELRFPVVGIGLRVSGMIGTAVPEAAVDENGHFGLAKDEVCRAAKAPDGACRHAVAKSLRMKNATKSQLWLGVTGTIALHRLAACGR